ncbi:MAG: RNA chaperone Hfq [Acidobacteria bacterium]|nr:RNA chaperone Hfq [Acidobacteriota bacterium]
MEYIREDNSVNRRSLRSSYTDYSSRGTDYPNRASYDQGNVQRGGGSPQRARKRVPPEQTHAENYYYRKQMEARTPMAIVLSDGETIFGTIEWYDKSCIKIHRNGEPNLLLFKHSIKYLYKQDKKVEVLQEEEETESLDEELVDEYDEEVEAEAEADE